MRRTSFAAVLALGVLGSAGVATAAAPGAPEYVVVYAEGAGARDAREAVEAAGGRIVSENTAIGVATVRSARRDFRSEAADEDALLGAAANEAIGRSPAQVRPHREQVERLSAAEARAAVAQVRAEGGLAAEAAPAGGDPLSPLQWDMRMIGATPEGSYARQQGNRAVRVGIMDTGIDASHPDIAPNFDRGLSRNFTVDDPTVDGPCESDPDGSCEDPADVDENDHGTHVASTIGSPLNGIGIAGVAPRVGLVNLRAGQDSGYFFLGPTLDALTYAADNGIDVVNMSFYIDPWLFNCTANPADSPAEQREQRLIITATQRAIDYARAHGVTTISSAGNGHTDLGDPRTDETSPDYPPGGERERSIDNSCVSMPTEADGVIGVTSVGPSGRKAYYSDYGIEQADVAAPGGDLRDFPGTPQHRQPSNLILAAYPEAVGRATDRDADGTPDIDEAGNPTTPFVVRDGAAYYQWIQGTSMAAPHATGVAALIVAEYGRFDRRRGGVTLRPDRVERILRATARDTACPEPSVLDYPDPELGPDFTATCEGNRSLNGFYGDGIVDALGAVTTRG